MSADFQQYRRRLPHWRKEKATYFVTWRIRPSAEDLAPPERTLLAHALRHFDGVRYDLWAFVVMNDHVHVLVTPKENFRLQDLVHSWKSFSAHRLQRIGHRKGGLWQDEYFDRIVRDESELNEKAYYIFSNPFKRWPELETYEWLHPQIM